MTSGGANSYWNLLIYLVQKYTNKEIAILAGKYFEVDIDRNNQGFYSIFEGCRYHNGSSVHKVQDYIEQHYHGNLTLKKLSEISRLGFRTVQRKFKKVTKYTVFTYIQKIRVESAKKLLEREKSIDEVMNETGYKNSEAFRRIFKRETGLSPIQYKKRYKTLS